MRCCSRDDGQQWSSEVAYAAGRSTDACHLRECIIGCGWAAFLSPPKHRKTVARSTHGHNGHSVLAAERIRRMGSPALLRHRLPCVHATTAQVALVIYSERRLHLRQHLRHVVSAVLHSVAISRQYARLQPQQPARLHFTAIAVCLLSQSDPLLDDISTAKQFHAAPKPWQPQQRRTPGTSRQLQRATQYMLRILPQP